MTRAVNTLAPVKRPKRPTPAQRLRALEKENRELREILERLASDGKVSVIRPDESAQAFNLGYRRGYSAAIQIHTEEVARIIQEEVFPLEDALRDLMTALAGASSIASIVGVQRADLRDALRPHLERIARDLYERYRNFDTVLAKREQAAPDAVAQGVMQFHEALIAFATGRDNGEALAKCDAVQHTIAGEIRATLAGVKVGGPPIKEARAWLGKHIAEARQREPGLTYAAATQQLYKELLARERAHELLEIEEQALAELDARADGIYRDYGNLPPGVVTYCKRAAEDWRKRGR